MAEHEKEIQQWFAEHVTLDSEPYTLDLDQARAASDLHQNTLVTARAGSGKTRVIVAKTAFLVAYQGIPLSQIAIFMFNRAAAAEVNQRISTVKVDGHSLTEISHQNTVDVVQIASTFHKFALDIVKQAQNSPQIISENDQADLIQRALTQAVAGQKISPQAYQELLNIVKGFIARAGQKFPGKSSLPQLKQVVTETCKILLEKSPRDEATKQQIFYHQVALKTYISYLDQLQPPCIDFNLLMDQATRLLERTSSDKRSEESYLNIRALRYVMIDEYQDFSYLFYALTTAIRTLAPAAHLFAVGDDWQAINRFAGSDVDYFINFPEYFPEDCVNIPLATNYRSAKGIVEHANRYMLGHYDDEALPARAHSKKKGKVKVVNPARQKFDCQDIEEDSLGDGRFLQALATASSQPLAKISSAAGKLLKQLYKICKKHRHEQIMLLHRHNFTSFRNLDLEQLQSALRDLLLSEEIMSPDEFTQQVRSMTMHKSKGLESDVVILLEFNREIVQSHHPHATIFPIFGDTLEAELADQQRLIYVALTRAKHQLYLLSTDQEICL